MFAGFLKSFYGGVLLVVGFGCCFLLSDSKWSSVVASWCWRLRLLLVITKVIIIIIGYYGYLAITTADMCTMLLASRPLRAFE